MKKIFSFVLAALMLLSLCACNNNNNDNTDPVTTDSTEADTQATVIGGEISWNEEKADENIVGAWQLTEGGSGEYYVFTEDCKVKVVRGTVYFEGTAAYGIDDDGIRTYFSNFQYLYGQLIYTVQGDLLTFMGTDGSSQTLTRVKDYTPVTLTAPESPVTDNELVGYWYNEEYKDSYEFNADGTALYTCDMEEEFGYISYIEYIYSADGEKCTLTYNDGTGEKVYEGGEYDFLYSAEEASPGMIVKKLTGLVIDGNEYARTEKPAE